MPIKYDKVLHNLPVIFPRDDKPGNKTMTGVTHFDIRQFNFYEFEF